jgi:hypothetical protein
VALGRRKERANKICKTLYYEFKMMTLLVTRDLATATSSESDLSDNNGKLKLEI